MATRCLALALVLALPLVVGCNPASKVIGTWDMKLPEGEDPAASGLGTRIPPAMLKAMQPKMNIEFKENGNCVVEAFPAGAGGSKEEGRGKWKYVKTEKDIMRLMVKMNGHSDEEEKTEYEEKEIQIRFINNNKIETVPLPVNKEPWSDQTLTFARRDF